MKPSSRVPRKPRYIAFVASSLDGRISLTKATRPNWTSREDWQWLQRSLARVDAVVVGRNTFRAAAARLRKRRTFVLTGRVKTSQRRGSVMFFNPRAVDVTSLFNEFSRVAVLGGARVYQFMLDRGWLDEFYVTIEPWLFGRGNPMLTGGTRPTRLHLQSVRRLNREGTLLAHYRIRRRR